MNEDLKYVLSLAVSIFIGTLSYLKLSNVIYGVLLSIIVFLILVIIILYLSYYKKTNELLANKAEQASPTSFLKNVYLHRGASQKEEIKLISEAKENIKILSISHRTLWVEAKDFKRSLTNAGCNGVKMTFLILDPKAKNLEKKAEDEGDSRASWRKDIEASIERFEQLEQDHPTINLELYTYDIFPIWHMVIIDDNIALIGYYPTGKSGSSSPLYLIKKSDLSLLTPFIKCFNTIKSSGNRIVPKA